MKEIFKNKEEVLAYIKEGEKNIQFQSIREVIQNIQKERNPFFLEKEDFEAIVNWKLGKQKGRQSEIRENNSRESIKLITQTAFLLSEPNFEIESKLKIDILRSLFGVEVRVASAILSVCFPEKYAVLDYRNWEVMYPKRTGYFTTKEYVEYLLYIRKLSIHYDVSPKEMDTAIWKKYEEIN
jgi:hypothetical protein